MSNIKFVNVYRNGLGTHKFDTAEKAREKAGEKAIITALAVAQSNDECEFINVYRNGVSPKPFKTAAKARQYAGEKAIAVAVAVPKREEPVQTLFTQEELYALYQDNPNRIVDLLETVVAKTVERLADA